MQDKSSIETPIQDKSSIGTPTQHKSSTGTHICPYGCGRQIPNEFKGCTELLAVHPRYFG
jgi:hypothetical protein